MTYCCLNCWGRAPLAECTEVGSCGVGCMTVDSGSLWVADHWKGLVLPHVQQGVCAYGKYRQLACLAHNLRMLGSSMQHQLLSCCPFPDGSPFATALKNGAAGRKPLLLHQISFRTGFSFYHCTSIALLQHLPQPGMWRGSEVAVKVRRQTTQSVTLDSYCIVPFLAVVPCPQHVGPCWLLACCHRAQACGRLLLAMSA